MDFSVIVPFYNAERFIERCARALLAQTIPAERYEILMVDNNSTDSSADIVRRFERIRLLHGAEQGSYASRNVGIAESRGAIAAFTDPDCEPRADWLEQIGRALAQPEISLILGSRVFASDTGIMGALAAYESALCQRMFDNRQVECYYGYTNNMAVRMSLLKELNGFQALARGADTLLLRRVAAQVGSAALSYIPEMRVRHLEIENIHDYLLKKRIYGSLKRDSVTSPSRALPLATRLSLALKSIGAVGASPVAAIRFLGALAAGSLEFGWERWKPGGRR